MSVAAELLARMAPLLAPAWRITLKDAKGERDLAPDINDRFMSLTVTDKHGIESDEFTLELDDADERLEIPPTKAVLNISIGWQGQPLVDKGAFTVDEVEYSGSPGLLRLRGRAAQVSGSLGVKKERSWHNKTLGDICRSLAVEHGLAVSIHARFDMQRIDHIDQTNESDANFLTRLGLRFDAVATIKNGVLIFTPAGASQSGSGRNLAPHTITRKDVTDTFIYQTNERDQYSGVVAYWHNGKSKRRTGVHVGKQDHEKALRDTYGSEIEAKRAAKAELARLQRGKATFSVTLAEGKPLVQPESPATVQGFKRVIDETEWLVIEVVHRIGSQGYTTDIQLETR